MTANRYKISFWGDKNILKWDSIDTCIISVTIGQTTELYILKGKFYGIWIISQINYHFYILIRIRKSNFLIIPFEKEIETL